MFDMGSVHVNMRPLVKVCIPQSEQDLVLLESLKDKCQDPSSDKNFKALDCVIIPKKEQDIVKQIASRRK